MMLAKVEFYEQLFERAGRYDAGYYEYAWKKYQERPESFPWIKEREKKGVQKRWQSVFGR